MDRPRLLTLILVAALPAGSTLAAPGEAGSVHAAGAAGVMEVGRPLDMLRARAERQARARAVEEAASRAVQVAGGVEGSHGAADAGSVEERVRSRAGAGSWRLRYWSNGAVTASWSLPLDGIDAPGLPGR